MCIIIAGDLKCMRWEEKCNAFAFSCKSVDIIFPPITYYFRHTILPESGMFLRRTQKVCESYIFFSSLFRCYMY